MLPAETELPTATTQLTTTEVIRTTVPEATQERTTSPQTAVGAGPSASDTMTPLAAVIMAAALVLLAASLVLRRRPRAPQQP